MVTRLKDDRLEIPKLLAAAEGQSCIKCGREDRTVVAAHYSGLGAHRLGRGGGVKCHDNVAADLCGECHASMDSYADGNDYERAVDFLILCHQTMTRRLRQKVLK